MQRSGRTAKTQSSDKAPGRGALSPAPSREGRSALPRGQAGGSGSRERSGGGAVPPSRGSDRRQHRSARRYATLPRDLAGNFGVFLRDGRASSITHTAPAAARGRRDRGTGGRGRGSEHQRGRTEGATERRDPSAQTSAAAEQSLRETARGRR